MIGEEGHQFLVKTTFMHPTQGMVGGDIPELRCIVTEQNGYDRMGRCLLAIVGSQSSRFQDARLLLVIELVQVSGYPLFQCGLGEGWFLRPLRRYFQSPLGGLEGLHPGQCIGIEQKFVVISVMMKRKKPLFRNVASGIARKRGFLHFTLILITT